MDSAQLALLQAMIDYAQTVLLRLNTDTALYQLDVTGNIGVDASLKGNFDTSTVNMNQFAHGKYKQGGLSGLVNYERMKMHLAAAPLKPKDILTNTKWIDKHYSDTAKAYLKYIRRLTQELKPFCAAKTTKSFE